MDIKLNNKEESIPGKHELTVQELLDYKKFTFKFLVIKVNGENVRREDFDTRQIVHGDHVLVLHLISGG